MVVLSKRKMLSFALGRFHLNDISAPKDLVVSQPRRFVAQNDEGTEGFGMLAWNLLGTWTSLGIYGPAMSRTLQRKASR